MAQLVPAATVVASVNIRVPVSLFQSPVVPSELELHVVTAKSLAVAVVDPVSPEIVTVEDVDPWVISQLAFNATVIRLVTPDTGVRCTIDLVLKVGTTTSIGFFPLVTPNRSCAGRVIAVEANVFVPEACILTACAPCAEVGFVTENAKV